MTDRGQKIYKEQLVFPTANDKHALKDVLDIYKAYFTPLQSTIYSWYNLGALQSHHCKDQFDFMLKLCNLTDDCDFTNPKKAVKFIS